MNRPIIFYKPSLPFKKLRVSLTCVFSKQQHFIICNAKNFPLNGPPQPNISLSSSKQLNVNYSFLIILLRTSKKFLGKKNNKKELTPLGNTDP